MQGDSIQAASEDREARRGTAIDTEGERLTGDRIFVRRTHIGYLFAGFGDASALLRIAFEDGGGLLVATDEIFSADNPAHVVAADAVRATLAPLQ